MPDYLVCRIPLADRPPVLDSQHSHYSISLAQVSAATLVCGPLLAAGALIAGRFTLVVLLDLCGCCLLSASLLAGHYRSQRPTLAHLPGGPSAALRRTACLLAFAGVGLAIAVSYNVQVAGPTARAGTIDDPGDASLQFRPEKSQGTTNITVHCENEEVESRRRGPRR